MCSAVAEYTSRIALSRPGVQTCLYFVTSSGSNEVACNLCTFVGPCDVHSFLPCNGQFEEIIHQRPQVT
jgi:hypothetical protein